MRQKPLHQTYTAKFLSAMPVFPGDTSINGWLEMYRNLPYLSALL